MFEVVLLDRVSRDLALNPKPLSLWETQMNPRHLTAFTLLAFLACQEDSRPQPATQTDHTRPYDGAKDAQGQAINPGQVRERVRAVITALPETAPNPQNPLTEPKVELGRMLFFETRLSKAQDISCNTCHDLEQAGVDVRESDGRRNSVSLGHEGQKGDRNAPTVFNAALHFRQFWDGRAADVEEQAQGPILNPVEMAMPNERQVLRVLKSIPEYVTRFKAAFPESESPITLANIGKTIGAFERTLLVRSAFDAFVEGDTAALSNEQLEGLQLFLDVGCTQCHTGSLIGGAQFQKLGTVKPWPDLEDEGRAAVTKSDVDRFMFKVPSLRLVTQTGPWLHDGSVQDLRQMVQLMAEHQTARGTLKEAEVDAIIAFLGSLDGPVPSEKIRRPDLPPDQSPTP